MIGAITAGLFSTGVAASTNSFESIATTTVGAGGSGTITFSSIPSTYKHLQIRITEANTGTQFQPKVNFNSDTAANYSYHYLNGNGSTTSAGAGTSQSAFYLVANPTSPTTAVHVIDVLDYADTNKYKTVRFLDGYDANGSGYIQLFSANWRSTAAINSITFTNGTFAQYSSFALYGIKG